MEKFREAFEVELKNILDWWREKMPDNTHGGFYGRIDGDNNLHPEADKGIILHARILWTFSAAAKYRGNDVYAKIADRAFKYIQEFFLDTEYGGVFWTVDFEGNPKEKTKQIYAQAFTLYALCEYFGLTQNSTVLALAEDFFNLIETHSLDTEKRGYWNAFAQDWSVIPDIRLSEKDENEAKIMNTHLHVLEAYTHLYRVFPTEKVKHRLTDLIEIFLDTFYRPTTGSLHIYFDEDWNPTSDHNSYGHDIETSWLLWEAVEVLGETSLMEKAKPICIHLAETVLKNGLDKDGALWNEGNSTTVTDTDKHWWPQAEAVIGFWNAWELTQKKPFEVASQNSWSFIKKYIKDPVGGEWHWMTDRQGTPIRSEDKAGPWKAPYHNGRMCLEMLRRISE